MHLLRKIFRAVQGQVVLSQATNLPQASFDGMYELTNVRQIGRVGDHRQPSRPERTDCQASCCYENRSCAEPHLEELSAGAPKGPNVLF